MRRALALLALVAASAYVIAFRSGEGRSGTLASDVYTYYYPWTFRTADG